MLSDNAADNKTIFCFYYVNFDIFFVSTVICFKSLNWIGMGLDKMKPSF